MAKIIPFPHHSTFAGRPRPLSRSLQAPPRGMTAAAEAHINALGRNFFWVINRDLPADSRELDAIVAELDTAITCIAASVGGPSKLATLYRGAVRVFLSKPRLGWRLDPFDVPELFVPNTATAAEIEAFVRRHASVAA